ncbi:hypothetical protein [Brachybacterium tyrofermentans]|uniref:hypothetical protein n=1 Tax=Brachybacterium tyrofermentans TaxID=47848 RepID=UPI00186627E3|nr:hypothetical protein [Brachybacterium tyrofermentans]
MTSSQYSWLPDHHLGVAATLAHTDEVIANLSEVLYAFQTQEDGIFQLAEVPVGEYSQSVVASVAPIPRKVQLLVVDAMVGLRNALEHTLFAEVEYRDGDLDAKAARQVEIPANETIENFQKWIASKRKNGPPSLQADSELLERIDALQPYHRVQDPSDHPLAILAAHTNRYKHRTVPSTAVMLPAMYREDQMPSSLSDLPRRPEAPLQVGEVIAENPIGTKVMVTLFPTVGINRPDTARWPVLMKELDQLAHWVRAVAVPRLITGAPSVVPALPARYAIAVGHEDDRSSLAGGSAKAAPQVHLERLSARMVRADMGETLGAMQDAPEKDQITAWLESLSDEEMLRRMSELRATFDYEPEIVLANFAIMEGMRDEAVRFGRSVAVANDSSLGKGEASVVS